MELGDQRAKDLIDASYSEPDTRRAIRRLHRALHYGRTGIQATKAYTVLGMKYEDLGNIRLAINYYTKSLEVGGPDGFVYFWRGQLYYQRRNMELARSDLEQALALGLSSADRTEAEQLLGKLQEEHES